MKIVGVIPSRFGSSRLPGKPLELIGDKPLVEHVIDNAIASKLDDVYVLTDDERIYDHVNGKCKVLMTSKKHESGTSRICEVLNELDADYIVNIQGDEPFLSPEIINKIVDNICGNYELYSVFTTLTNKDEVNNPNNVKVVCNKLNEAMYFSRSVIPFERNEYSDYKKHIGMYIYSREFLSKYTDFTMSSLEKSESLEQLTFLYEGFKIKMLEMDSHPIGIDTYEDLLSAREYYEQNK